MPSGACCIESGDLQSAPNSLYSHNSADGRRHPQLQPALSSAGTDEWVLSWRLNEQSDSSGDRRAVGSRFQVLEQHRAKLRWPVDVRVQGTRRTAETAQRDWRRPSVDAAGTQRSVGQVTWYCVVQTLPRQQRRRRDHSKPVKCLYVVLPCHPERAVAGLFLSRPSGSRR